MAPSSRTAEVFRVMRDAVEHDGPSLVSRVQSVIQFEVEDAGVWLVDLKTSPGSVKTATTADGAADVTITLSEDTFLNMVDDKIVPQQALMKGLVKVRGNMRQAMKLNVVLAATRKHLEMKSVDKQGPTAVVSDVAPPTAPALTKSLDSKELFRLLGEVVVTDGAAMAKKVKGVIQFDIPGAGQWHLDLKSDVPALTEDVKKADVVITVSDSDFVAIAMGKLNAQQAFMKGKLKLKGNMMLAMKLPVVFNALKPVSKL
uniref:SCP2 domain-containing protein n=1 Tax=Peronospora matthiolae TaxID=2874970 RepID=A0AAV1UV07_9STRA